MNANSRGMISKAVKDLRRRRCYSQAEFAKILGITQAGLSHIESAKSSLSAEQLFVLIEKFNLSIDDFYKRKKVLPEQELQNAMARLGADHLMEIKQVVVPEALLDVNELIFDVLARAYHSRLIAHLAPVVVKNIYQIDFLRIFDRLLPMQKRYRIWWLVEQICAAVNQRLSDNHLTQKCRKDYLDAERILLRYKDAGETLYAYKHAALAYDILDNELISQGYVSKAQERSDACAKKWGVITSLKVTNFYESLKETDEYHH